MFLIQERITCAALELVCTEQIICDLAAIADEILSKAARGLPNNERAVVAQSIKALLDRL